MKRETHTHTHEMNERMIEREITTTAKEMCSNQQAKKIETMYLAPATKKNLLETTLFFRK